MRIRLLLIAALSTALASAAATTSVATASAPSASTPPVTQSVVTRPVTTAGQPASGFQSKAQHYAIDCSSPDPSPGAVDRDIEFCSPSAAYAIACWKAAKAHHTLCMRNPRSHRLYRFRLTGGFANTAVVKPKFSAPLLIVLAGGARCSIRDGGAWGTLQSHPTWSGSYSCTKHGVVWASPHSKHYGIDESTTSWSVHTAAASGHGQLSVRYIKRAYFVGTATA